jgi:hypothetical protein
MEEIKANWQNTEAGLKFKKSQWQKTKK